MAYNTRPNQRKVTIHKCDGKKNYSKIDRTANKKAMSKLGYSAYMLYMLFCMNATDFEMILSKAAICSETSLTAVLSVPTIIASLCGMDVGGIPFATSSFGFWAVLGIAVLAAVVSFIFMYKKQMFR